MPLKKRPLQLIYDQLPSDFTRNDLVTLLKKHHRAITPEIVIRKYKLQNLIRPTGYNQFSKVLNP